MIKPPSNSSRHEGRKKLGEYLLEDKIIAKEDIIDALKEQETRSDRIGRLLIEKEMITEEQLARVLAEQHNLPFIQLEDIDIPANVIALAPYKLARMHQLIPFKLTNGELYVVSYDPRRLLEAEKDIRFIVEMPIKAAVTTKNDLKRALQRYYPANSPLNGAAPDDSPEDIEILLPDETEEETIEDIEKIAELPPVVRFANRLFAEAISMKASDIHIEPRKDDTFVRFRIDGNMRPIKLTKKNVHLPLVSRIKILAGMDISTRRQPQDGKAQVRYSGKVFDLRVSTLPTYYGEKVTIRILDPAVAQLCLEDIGLSSENLKKLIDCTEQPEGLIIVTGPTGSGKTSTLYACLNRLNTPDVNVITVEDPVEFDVEGINQVQINVKSGVGFAAVLRSILRQDPDIVMVGEIRDAETAGISMQAAQTGHLVLTTLHTNDAPSSIMRVMDLEVEPFLISSSLLISVAQRLVRKLCPHCKAPKLITNELFNRIAPFLDNSDAKFWEGKGCEACNNTGYKGRIGIFELMVMSPTLKKAVSDEIALEELKKIARAEGYRTMFEDGLKKALKGITSLDEILRKAYPKNEASDTRKIQGVEGLGTDIRTFESAQDLKSVQTVGRVEEKPAFLPENETNHGADRAIVLLVDDNPEILAVLERTLAGENIQVMTAGNGLQALEAIRNQKPDLVVTDYKMPIMDGYTLIKKLKESARLSSIPVLMLTAKDDVESEISVFELGADDYLVKPVDRRRFTARVSRLLKYPV